MFPGPGSGLRIGSFAWVDMQLLMTVLFPSRRSIGPLLPLPPPLNMLPLQCRTPAWPTKMNVDSPLLGHLVWTMPLVVFVLLQHRL